MLVPGPYSIGQKLLLVSYCRIKVQRRKTRAGRIAHDKQPTALTAHTHYVTVSPKEAENAPTTKDAVITGSATIE